MRQFSQLFNSLDQTTRTNDKITAIADYFVDAAAADAAWTIFFLSGHRLRRVVPTRELRDLAIELSGIEPWLFEECYEAVGDLAETIALVVPKGLCQASEKPLSSWVTENVIPLRSMSTDRRKQTIKESWEQLDQTGRFIFNKLLTGAFRVGVSARTVVKGLARAHGIDADVLSHRLMGNWEADAEFYNRLIDPDTSDAAASKPYPFFLASPLEDQVESLGDAKQWRAEWKWDGIRAQIIRRTEQTFIWSRGEELMTDRFPELHRVCEQLQDGTVLDGEILATDHRRILPFTALQKRIGLKRVTQKAIQETPIVFFAFDLLEQSGQDLRQQELATRLERLHQTVSGLPADIHRGVYPSGQLLLFEAEEEVEQGFPPISLPPEVEAFDWPSLSELRAASREFQTEGLMLKRLDSIYRVGRTRGDWWKWKIDPYTIDCVLTMAQRGHGKRASLYSDYTFSVWHDGELVPFAKAYSGLTDAEIRKVDHFVRNNTLKRFGPMRSVNAELVFELAFENIQASSRHKSGVAVRFPRIVRWRDDKTIEQADNLSDIQRLASAPTKPFSIPQKP